VLSYLTLSLIAILVLANRKFRDAIHMLFGADQLVGYISSLKNGLWPGGQLKPKEPPRTAAQKAATRDSAHRKLSALMPGAPSSFQWVGEETR